ncbi:MAG: hypothetical protein ACYDGU_07905 [Acidiferrobacterales bacterium]
MTHSCPHCHAALGVCRNRIRRRYGRRPGVVAWYHYSATRFFCPACGVELKIVTRPAGYVIYTLMISVSAYILFYFPHSPALLRANPWALIGRPPLIVLPFAIAHRKWGFRYSVVAREPASGNPFGETRR